MFKAANPYDEVVIKATDENLTSENWQLNLDVCDKVTTEGTTGARNCVAAILKRLVHRNANVQLYSLTLSDALSKNCGEIAHGELASRSFTQTLQRIVTDRNTHDTVRKKSLGLIKEWNQEWGNDESVGLIRETMESLKKQGFSVQNEQETAPVEPASEQLRAEDEELRRVLELSLQDQGGRTGYASAPTGVGSSSSATPSTQATSSGYAPPSSINKNLPDPSRQSSGSTPQNLGNGYSASTPAAAAALNATSSSSYPAPAAPSTDTTSPPAASRVRALYDFTPTESGELAFRKGDVLRVLDSVYEHWWRGEVNGEVGIFPVNFVEVLPDPTPADVQREAELEAKIFAQANNIDRLLSKLRGLDPARDNLAEDEELQELYQSSLSMRPKIVKLIDRYNSKVSELRSMNEKFVRARSTFDVMMEQSLAKYNPGVQSQEYTNARVDYNAGYGGYGGGGGAPPMSNGSSYQQQAPPATSPVITQQAYHAQQQQPQYHQQQTGEAPAYTQQQQQEYAQAWAAYYDQQQQAGPGQAGAPPMMAPSMQGASSSSSSAPPNVNDPGYAQWYYSQQQQQPQQQGAAATSSAPATTGYDYRQAQQPADPNSSLHDQDKRAMFERARAEAEAYHRAHQQHASSSELPLQ